MGRPGRSIFYNLPGWTSLSDVLSRQCRTRRCVQRTIHLLRRKPRWNSIHAAKSKSVRLSVRRTTTSFSMERMPTILAFFDTNPAAKPEEKYKALSGLHSQLHAYSSPDGIHWKKMHAEPVMTSGVFDSLNLAFWDASTKCYRAYSRYFDGGGYNGFRSIQLTTSNDFLNWTEPLPNQYPPEAPREHFYTNATWPCPGASSLPLISNAVLPSAKASELSGSFWRV